jgi:hypothetical protein
MTSKGANMYLHSRTRTARPERLAEATVWAAEAAAQVTKITGIAVSPWTCVFGLPAGSLSWSARVESHAEIGAMKEKIALDKTYAKLLAQTATLFEGPAQDHLVEFVAMAGSPNSGRYASLVRAECASGNVGKAMAWGVDTMKHVAKITNLPGSFVRSLYGEWGGVGWITLGDSFDDVDKANQAIAADTGYVERLDLAGTLFRPGSASTVLLQNLS